MKQKMLDRMTQLRSQATTDPVRSQTTPGGLSFQSSDSLGHVVRNSEEAQQFREELNAAVKLARQKKAR